MSDSPNTTDKQSLNHKVKETLSVLLSFYDLSVDLEGLLEEMPVKQEESYLSYISRFLERIGFEARKESAVSLNISDIKQPILLQPDEHDFALVMPRKIFGQGRYIFASNEAQEKELGSSFYSGDILHINPQSDDISSYAAHMKKGYALDWFWQPIVKHWGSYYEIIVASLFINLLVLSIPLFSLNVYDRVIINFAEETLAVLTIGVMIALIFDFLFKNIRSYILERLTENLGNEYDFKLMERLLNIKLPEMSLSIGEQANMFREMHSIREFFAGRLIPTIVDLPFMMLFIFIIYLLSPPLAMVPITMSVIIIISNLLVHIPISRMTEEYFAAIQSKSSLLIETLAGLQTLKMFSAKSNRLFQWDLSLSKTARVSRHNFFMMSLISNFTFTASQICHVFVIFFGVYQIQEGSLTIGGLITCTILSARAIAPVMSFSALLARLKQSNDVLKAIDKFFQLPYEDPNEAQKSPKGPFQGHIKIQQASYQYSSQNKPALHNINLDIKGGQHVGIIGKTAAGKSTLAKMIAGFIDPTEGTMSLDGFNYNVIPQTEMSRTVSYAPQDNYFFRGSILYNVTLGREDLSSDAVEEAILVSGLDLVIQQNSQGMDMEVGEQGIRLSGGQKQAISLARAIVRKPQIIIFDEPTNGMDSTLEQHVKTKLKDYINGKTFIMITHRTSLLSLVDRLVLMDSGRIAADGSRDDILSKLSK